jgi:hypothetical protein
MTPEHDYPETVAAGNLRQQRKLIGRAGRVLLVWMFAAWLCTACGGSSSKEKLGVPSPRTIRLHVGETRRFSSDQLSSGSRIVCEYRRDRNTFVVPKWPSERSFELGERGTSDAWMRISSNSNGMALIASCRA